MDIDILKTTISNSPVRLSTTSLLSRYNEVAPIKISYKDLISALASNEQLYEIFTTTNDERQRRLTLALNDAEDQLYQQAQQGDMRAIEFLLKTRNHNYQEQKQIKINISSSDEYKQRIQSRRLELEDIVDVDTDD